MLYKMRATYMSNKFTHVTCIVAQPKQHNFGHYNRIKLLQEYCSTHAIIIEIFFLQNSYSLLQTLNLTEYSERNIILDARDQEFPSCILNLQKDKMLIAIDNQGKGRQQANIVWDILPHLSMNIRECKQALQNIWIPLDLQKFQTKNTKFQIEILNDINQLPQNTFFHYHSNFSMPYYSRRDYLQQLVNADNVSTYFGQTMFESLYLGKRVFLNSISPYHQQLHHFFIDINKKYPSIYKFLDGKGYYKFIKMIKNFTY